MATNYGDLEIDVTIDGEVDGEVQEATGGIADKNYNHLNHKPQINSVELEGNKSLEDLGIPENLSDLGDVEITDIQNGQTLIYNSESEKFENADAGTGSGDMLKSVYDTNDDSSVDSADTLLGLEASVSELNALDGIEGNVQSQLNSKADSSDLGTASAYDVPESGNAQSGEVVLGSDTRLSDSRNAKDVYLWAKQENKPSYSYSEIQNAPTVNNSTITIQKNSQNVDSFTLNQDSNKSINIAVPTKTSDLQNDDSFITNTVDNLANYYLKNQTYTQTEVDNLIQATVNGRFQKVNALPVTGEPNIIYLVPKTTPETSNACDEYIWQDNAWELIGSTEIDLSDYVTDTELTTALQDYLTTSAFNTAIANYYNKTEIGTLLDGKVDKVAGKGLSTNDYDNTAKGIVDGVTSALSGKADKTEMSVTNGTGADTDKVTIQLKSGTSATVLKDHQDISGKADKSEMSITDGTGSDADKTTIQLKNGLSKTVLTAHQDISNKVDKDGDKVLSTNDYTDTDKNKLADISTEANKVEASTTNGNILIDGVETQVYDDSDVVDDITEIQSELSTATTQAIGNPINFSTLSAQNSQSTIIDLEPIQDLHGYDKPWVGGAGKNLFNKNDSGISPNARISTNTGGTYSSTGNSASPYIEVTANTVYTLTNTFTAYCAWYDSTKTFISGSGSTWGSGQGHTAPSTAKYVRFDFPSSDADIVQLEQGETATSYEPYANLCPITGRNEIGILQDGKNLFEFEQGSRNANGTLVDTQTRCRSKYIYPLGVGTYKVIATTSVSGKVLRIAYNFWANTTTNNTREYDSGWITLSSNGVEIELTDPENFACAFSYNDDSAISINDLTISFVKINSLTIQFGETVYGSSLDVENGVLVVNRKFEEFDGSNDEGWTADTNFRFYITRSDFNSPARTEIADIIANYITATKREDIDNKTWSVSGSGSAGGHTINVKFDETMTDLATFKTYLSNNHLQMVYPLSTPITINLTPNTINLLKGVNNISVSDDYSTITLTYRSGEVATLGDLLETENKMLAKQHTYSTDEQIVGTWIDGKPLYEKCIEIASLPSSATDDGLYSTGLSNIDKMWIVGGYVEYNNGEQMLPLNTWRLSDTYAVGCRITNDNYITFSVGTDRSSLSAVVVLQYTKTTD